MKSRTFRTFDVDGIMYSFSLEGFKNAITQYQIQQKEEGKPYLLKDISEELATELNITVEALNNWRKGYNGPSDIERIKEISTVLGCNYKELLKTREGEVHMVTKEVSYNPNASEKEAIQSIINDLLEIIECFGKTNAFEGIPLNSSDEKKQEVEKQSEDIEEWFFNIRKKLRKSSYHIPKENMLKLERLFLETKAFVDYSSTRPIKRWSDICMGFNLQIYFDDLSSDAMLDIDELLSNDDFINDDMRKYLWDELGDYFQGEGNLWDPPIEVIGYKIGAWYMEIVRHDFPELFVD